MSACGGAAIDATKLDMQTIPVASNSLDDETRALALKYRYLGGEMRSYVDTIWNGAPLRVVYFSVGAKNEILADSQKLSIVMRALFDSIVNNYGVVSFGGQIFVYADESSVNAEWESSRCISGTPSAMQFGNWYISDAHPGEICEPMADLNDNGNTILYLSNSEGNGATLQQLASYFISRAAMSTGSNDSSKAIRVLDSFTNSIVEAGVFE